MLETSPHVFSPWKKRIPAHSETKPTTSTLLRGVMHEDIGRLAMSGTNRRILSFSSATLGLDRVAGDDLVFE